MLPAAHRLRASADFVTVLRTGQRVGRPHLVLHYAVRAGVGGELPPTRFGLVVGKSVGNSVVRHQVSRRLRAQLSERIARFPLGVDVVVRARPESAAADSAVLGRDLDRAMERLFANGSAQSGSARSNSRRASS